MLDCLSACFLSRLINIQRQRLSLNPAIRKLTIYLTSVKKNCLMNIHKHSFKESGSGGPKRLISQNYTLSKEEGGSAGKMIKSSSSIRNDTMRMNGSKGVTRSIGLNKSNGDISRFGRSFQ